MTGNILTVVRPFAASLLALVILINCGALGSQTGPLRNRLRTKVKTCQVVIENRSRSFSDQQNQAAGSEFHGRLGNSLSADLRLGTQLVTCGLLEAAQLFQLQNGKAVNYHQIA